MTRRLKALGLALVAVFAMSAVVTSVASAHTPARFTAPVSTTITGTDHQTNSIFAVTGLNIECHGSYHGVTSSTSTSQEVLTVKPAFTDCEAESIIGTMAVTVTGFGHYGVNDDNCDLRFRADEKLDIECKPGTDITIHAGTCTIHIPPQIGLGTITYTTGVADSVHDLTVHVDATNVTATHTDGFACPLTSSGEASGTSLVGKITFTGENAAAVPQHITWDATT